MSVTYSSAAERDVQRTARRVSHVRLADLALALTSGAALLAITLASTGRLTAFERSENTRPGAQLVNLNTVADPGPLEPVMATVFANAYDRRLAAQELFRFMIDERTRGRALPNVGAIAHATVSAAVIERSNKLEVFSERLRVLTQNVANAGRAGSGLQTSQSRQGTRAALPRTRSSCLRIMGRSVRQRGDSSDAARLHEACESARRRGIVEPPSLLDTPSPWVQAQQASQLQCLREAAHRGRGYQASKG